MGTTYLYGWDTVNGVWVKLICNAEGKLIIDPSEIFEDPPTEDEHGKAPASSWAFDHKADVNAHHTKFTVAEHDTADRHPLANLDPLVCSESEADGKIADHKGDAGAHHEPFTTAAHANPALHPLANLDPLVCSEAEADVKITTHKGDASAHHESFTYADHSNAGIHPLMYLDPMVCSEAEADAKIGDHKGDASAHHTKFTIAEHDSPERHPLANLDPQVCSESEADVKIESHRLSASAHHTRYTDEEARSAVGYNGTKHWTCSGLHFDARYPDVHDVTKESDGTLVINDASVPCVASVLLPHDAVITHVVVFGNEGASDCMWYLYKSWVTGGETFILAHAHVNVIDDSIEYPSVNNWAFHYYFYVTALAAGDVIYSARITYTI